MLWKTRLSSISQPYQGLHRCLARPLLRRTMRKNNWKRIARQGLRIAEICAVAWVGLTVTTLLTSSAVAQVGRIAHNTPRYVATAKNLGAADQSKKIDVSIWLNPHNRGDLEKLAR